ncbi:peptide deformylase [Magnetococcus marinus MC-1]|uniref:Peptide deformylase n=1 Tax=Magnetococcus marinus (strain ATCC BAA-1437 / JCM 17883 / MC-1) TaxID=156889 RepID=A0LDD7_MAGMM|nr:peptide deformylase [Magnetococcus marinus]ABK45980.1 peptide deformylase [Magnetococcus marinus MC-1]
MAILDVLVYPDQRLLQPCRSLEAEEFKTAAFQAFVEDLIETTQHAPGCVGLAAPQVDHAIRMVVVNCGLARKPPDEHHGELILCNPEIISWEGMETAREGCMSVPDYTGNVMRATHISVQFQDRHGQEQVRHFKGFEARVVQHEMDHLEGKLFTDRVVSRKADLFPRKVYQKKRNRA